MIARAPLVTVTLRGLLGRRRLVLMLLLVLLPVLVAILVRVSGGRLDAAGILDALMIRTVMPLVALVIGTTALGSELEDGTAIFLLTKPIARWRIVLAKLAVAGGLTVALVFPASLATGLIVSPAGAAGTALGYASAAALGAVAYASVFLALSAVTSRAIVVGLAYVLLWEGALAGLLEGTRFLSIRQGTLGVAAWLTGVHGSRVPLEIGTAASILAVAIVAGFAVATVRLAEYEVRAGD
ncbi:MAG: ABC transporter permease subunit [Chloroflexota bacterium]